MSDACCRDSRILARYRIVAASQSLPVLAPGAVVPVEELTGSPAPFRGRLSAQAAVSAAKIADSASIRVIFAMGRSSAYELAHD
jgi:hypothetical protein